MLTDGWTDIRRTKTGHKSSPEQSGELKKSSKMERQTERLKDEQSDCYIPPYRNVLLTCTGAVVGE
ncbi:hypothetical protein DPMN_154956 [Dreissena polymorpha]|uniref:Uncharacterized protein n=1 Tax=Dreissena polymorpha TaxID=45954 RepID=A0A9D4FM18_DREPO|nr:hypothetical protein DPMN_154956 [Dreissena polymorpha]